MSDSLCQMERRYLNGYCSAQERIAQLESRVSSLERRVMCLETECSNKQNTIDRLIREADTPRPTGATL